MSKWLLSVLSFLALIFLATFTVFAAQTCPDGGGWIKIDSGNLSTYPVSGATDYCFKAGTEVYDDLESWQSSGKDLSHWSYFIPEFTPTPPSTEEPTATPTSTQEPTATPEPTETPGSTSTPGPTQTPRPTTTSEPTKTPSRPTPTYTATPRRIGTGTPTSTPWTATPSSDPRIPCPCVETVIIQGESDEYDDAALWAAITLLAGTNAAWMIKRRKLEK